MPRGYSILVGVPYVDVGAPFYSREFSRIRRARRVRGGGPGYPGAWRHWRIILDTNRCWGSRWLGPKATVANVMAAIESLAKPEIGLDHGDHVLLYRQLPREESGELPR